MTGFCTKCDTAVNGFRAIPLKLLSYNNYCLFSLHSLKQ